MNKQITIPVHYLVACIALVCIAGSFSVVGAAVSSFNDGIAVGTPTLSSGLLLDVDGKIGATEYCDPDGLNCLAAGVGSLGGSGTSNYVAKFSDSDTLAISQIQDDGTNVGVGRTPAQKLDVNGNMIARSGHLFLGAGGDQDLYGDNGPYLYFDSNDSDDVGFNLRDAENTSYGWLYGSGGNGENFGLLDGAGTWVSIWTPVYSRLDNQNGDTFLYALPDSYTYLYYDATWKLRTRSNGSETSGTHYASDFLYSSDRRLKENITAVSGLDVVLGLDGVSFDWKETGDSSVGFIAQDVETIAPLLVDTDEETGYKSVRYGSVSAYLVEAIKEQQEIIEDQQRQINELRSLIK